MAVNWVKSLPCKSTSIHDVHQPSHKHPLLPSSSCRNSFQNLKDVFDIPSKPKPNPKPKPKPKPIQLKPNPKVPNPFFSSVSELQVGHPSRNVVEIIFQTRWGPKGFSGRVDMVFKIHNMTRIASQFEEYRDYVKSRCGSHSARCSADGNEMMRFRCLGPTFSAGKSAISTFSGSGAAHESAGRGRGRRGMLVCRVIAGRVSRRVGGESLESEFDSVSGENGELLVFDNRAVLACFLVVYKL